MFTVSLGIFLFGLIAATAGGAMGAAIGGNYAFVFTGLMILTAFGVRAATSAEVGNVFFNYVAFGPFFGPHIAFAGGAAAAAYAANKKHYKVPAANRTDAMLPDVDRPDEEFQTGKDVSEPLARLNRADVLAVGALFGILGYLVQIGISNIPWFGGNVDSIALTVVTSGIVARLAFGGSFLNADKFNKDAQGFMAKIAPTTDHFWLRYQEKPSAFIGLGVWFGIAAGGVAIAVATLFEGAHVWANTLPFAMSAVVILFLILGHRMPVQHHATNIAGLFAVKYLPIFVGGTEFNWLGAWLPAGSAGAWDSSTWTMAALVIALSGVVGALVMALAELSQRICYARGNSHIDPPAMAIWIGSFVVLATSGLIGGPTVIG